MAESPHTPANPSQSFPKPSRPFSGRGTLLFVTWGALSSALFYLPLLELPHLRPGSVTFWGTLFAIGMLLMLAQALALAVSMGSARVGCLAFIVPELIVPFYTVAIIVWYYQRSPVGPLEQLRQLWQWYRSKTRNIQIAVGAATLVVTLALCSGIGSVFASGGIVTGEATPSSVAYVSPTETSTTSTTSMSATAPAATIAPTATLAPTATPTLVAIAQSPLADAAVLGGPESAFEAKYGAPNDRSQPPSTYNFGANNYLMVNMDMGAIGNYGPAAEAITASAPDKNPMTPTFARGYCLTYAPSDARYVKQVTYTDANGVEGVDYVYQSNVLAKVFPANAFQDKNSNSLAPGTFDVQLLYSTPNDSSQIDSCSLALGFTQY